MEAPTEGHTAPTMQARLVQQLARIGKFEDECRADLRRSKEEAWHTRQKCNMLLARLAPKIEKWIAADFMPDTPRLRKLARLYIKLVQRRQEARFTDGLAEKYLAEAN
jgi:hypothetical protein